MANFSLIGRREREANYHLSKDLMSQHLILVTNNSEQKGYPVTDQGMEALVPVLRSILPASAREEEEISQGTQTESHSYFSNHRAEIHVQISIPANEM